MTSGLERRPLRGAQSEDPSAESRQSHRIAPPAKSPLRAALVSLITSLAVACTQSIRVSPVPGAGGEADREWVRGIGFEHLIYCHGISAKTNEVHVYLEGDGLPWVTRTRVARDPTPRTPLVLGLMAKDSAASLYLGRPCYHGPAQSAGCSPWLWTHGRYSETVVDSMVAALHHALGSESKARITLIGYSGGGVLAMLMAARTENVQAVVTIAANLDTDAWADYHGYSRLNGSLNPAAQPPLDARVRQIHLAGGRDNRVPAHLAQLAAVRQPNTEILTVPGFDHICCWELAWPSILAALEQPASALEAESLHRFATAATRP